MGLLGDSDVREEGRMQDVIQVGLEGGWMGGLQVDGERMVWVAHPEALKGMEGGWEGICWDEEQGGCRHGLCPALLRALVSTQVLNKCFTMPCVCLDCEAG